MTNDDVFEAVSQNPTMHVNANTLRDMKIAKVFRDNHDKINSIDFAEDGELLVTSGDDDQIIVYDCTKGVWVCLNSFQERKRCSLWGVYFCRHKRSINSKKYGVDLIRFTHARNTAIHASNKLDGKNFIAVCHGSDRNRNVCLYFSDTIRYLSLHDNKYIRYFIGHNKRWVSNLQQTSVFILKWHCRSFF